MPIAACAPAFNGFQLPAVALPFVPNSFATGDIDGDQRIDIVVHDASQIAVLRNLGDGSLQLEPIAVTGSVGALAAGKLPGDSRATIAIAPANAPGLELISALNDGGFSLATFDGGVTAASLVFANLAGAAGSELVAREPGGSIAVLSSASGNTVSQRVEITGGSAIAPIDLDGDGRDDLLVDQADGGIDAVRSVCGVLQPPAATGLPALSPWATMDFDGDHLADVVGKLDGAFQAYRGRGDGTFVPFGPPLDWPRSSNWSDLPASISVVALGANQLPELVLSTGDGIAEVVRSDASGFAATAVYDLLDTAGGLTAADLNGDGLPDLVAIAAYGKSEARGFLAESNGRIRAARVYWPGAADLSPSQDALAVGDYDGDGKPDFCTGTICGGAFMSFTNEGDRKFADTAVTWPQSVLLQTTPEGLGLPPGLAIVDGEGYPAKLGVFGLADGGAAVSIPIPATYSIQDNVAHQFAMRGFLADGGVGLVFAQPGNLPAGAALFVPVDGGYGDPQPLTSDTPNALTVGDFDGDGRVDLATAGQQVTVVLNGPAGLGSSATSYALVASDIASGDIDGDGRDEIAVAASWAAEINLLGLNADDTGLELLAQAPLDPGFAPSAVTVGDLTGDGFADVIVAGDYWGNAGCNNELEIFPGDGRGGLRAPLRIELLAGPGRAPTDLAIADFDLDGRPDLLVASGFSANRGAQIFFNPACR